MKQISLTELKQWETTDKDFQLIDVREPSEHQFFNIGGSLIPLDQIMKNAAIINHDKPVVLYCKRGIRSQIAIQKLERKHPFDNLYNLQGGIFKLLLKQGSL